MAKGKKGVKKVRDKSKTSLAKGPRQKSLPGMEDRAIRTLNDAALAYDEVKKERMALTEQEVEAKENVRELMHKAKRTHYRYKNITIDLVPEGEAVKVRVKSQAVNGEEEEEAETPEVEPEGEEPDTEEEVEEPETESAETEEVPEVAGPEF